jgi:hypothetical protein
LGGANLPLPRASQGHPISCCLNFFKASGERRGMSGRRVALGKAYHFGCGFAALS